MRGLMIAAALLGLAAAGAPQAAGAAELAQVHATPTAPAQALVRAFFVQLRKGDTRAAFTAAFQGTDMAAQKPADIENLVNQVEVALKYYGTPGQEEFVREQAVGEAVLRQDYVLRTDKGPLFWTFYFYRRTSGWTLNSVDFNDNIRGAFG